MDISTINVIIGAVATTIGAALLFTAGAILQAIRSTNREMKAMNERTIKHEVKIEGLESWLREVDDKVYKLAKSA